jgi:hypothetical protein
VLGRFARELDRDGGFDHESRRDSPSRASGPGRSRRTRV